MLRQKSGKHPMSYRVSPENKHFWIIMPHENHYNNSFDQGVGMTCELPGSTILLDLSLELSAPFFQGSLKFCYHY